MMWLRKHKHLVLVLTLVCAYTVQESARGAMVPRVVPNVFISVILLAVLLGVFENLRSQIVALILVVATIFSVWAHYGLGTTQFELPVTIAHYALLIVFFGYSVAVILGNIFRKSAVGADDVMGAVSGYLIAGAAWSSLYALTQTLLPDSFTLAPGFAEQLSDWPGRTAVFNYFSIVTLTTMGYGDITPIRAPATVFAMMEAVFGQFYIAVVVAQLVGARMSNAVQAGSGDS